MTKAEFIDAVQKANKGADLSKKAVAEMVDSVFHTMSQAIKKDKRFSYPGFGTMVVKQRAARKGRNPRTGAEIKIRASKTVSFKCAPALKKQL